MSIRRQGDEQVDVVRHDYVRADVGAVLFSMMSERKERFPCYALREDRLSIKGAGSNEVNWKGWEDPVQAADTLWTRYVLGVGGYRPPLQGSGLQPFQQLLVNSFKSAVTEDSHHIVLFQKRNEPLYYMRGVRFVERRAARSRD